MPDFVSISARIVYYTQYHLPWTDETGPFMGALGR